MIEFFGMPGMKAVPGMRLPGQSIPCSGALPGDQRRVSPVTPKIGLAIYSTLAYSP